MNEQLKKELFKEIAKRERKFYRNYPPTIELVFEYLQIKDRRMVNKLMLLSFQLGYSLGNIAGMKRCTGEFKKKIKGKNE